MKLTTIDLRNHEASIADSLFGIMMEEPGVSKRPSDLEISNRPKGSYNSQAVVDTTVEPLPPPCLCLPSVSNRIEFDGALFRKPVVVQGALASLDLIGRT